MPTALDNGGAPRASSYAWSSLDCSGGSLRAGMLEGRRPARLSRLVDVNVAVSVLLALCAVSAALNRQWWIRPRKGTQGGTLRMLGFASQGVGNAAGDRHARTTSITALCGGRSNKPSAGARNPDRDRSRGVRGRHCPPSDPPVAPPVEQRRGLP